jgi:hypothetical protein
MERLDIFMELKEKECLLFIEDTIQRIINRVGDPKTELDLLCLFLANFSGQIDFTLI